MYHQSVINKQGSYSIIMVSIIVLLTISMVTTATSTINYSPYKSVDSYNSIDSPYSTMYLPSSSSSSSDPSSSLLSPSSSSPILLPPPKRYSEFLGGPGKRLSEFLGGPGKRSSSTYGYLGESGKKLRATSGYYLAKKLSEILSPNPVNIMGPSGGPYRPGGSEFLGGPGKR